MVMDNTSSPRSSNDENSKEEFSRLYHKACAAAAADAFETYRKRNDLPVPKDREKYAHLMGECLTEAVNAGNFAMNLLFNHGYKHEAIELAKALSLLGGLNAARAYYHGEKTPPPTTTTTPGQA